MNADDLIVMIEHAFADVRRDDGVSMHEADVIDKYGSESERRKARLKDPDSRWQDVPDSEIEEHSEALCFLDLKGFRYYLPAYMRWTVRHFKTSDSFTADATIYALTLSDRTDLQKWEKERWVVFNDEQSRVILKFLDFMANDADELVDSRSARAAIDTHWKQFSQQGS
jgi:hypothetical protein